MGKSFTLHLDGTAYTVESRGRALLINGKRFEPEISGSTVTIGETKMAVDVQGDHAFVDGIAHLVTTEGLDERPRVEEHAAAAAASGSGTLTAIMPGLIIKVPVSVGDAVAGGDVIVVLEAMKMENEICAPVEGVVKEVFVKAGDIVEQNQRLALIE